MLIFYHVTSCYRNTKCGNTTKTKLIKKYLNVFMKENREDFLQEQRINQLSAAEFGNIFIQMSALSIFCICLHMK
jgi:hypothetical protein